MSKRGAHFSFSPEQDRLYSLGWPHVRTLVDKSKLDKKPEETARAVLADQEPTSLFSLEWPREAAHRFVRAIVEPRSAAPDKASPEQEIALAKPGPVTSQEAASLIGRAIHPSHNRVQHHVWELLLLLEAIVGTADVTEAIVARFERYAPKDWQHDNLQHAFFTAPTAPVALPAAYYLGFFLLRLPESARKKYRARIEKLLKAAPVGRPLHVAFDLVLHGGEAVRRHRVRALCAAHHVTDDPRLVRSLSQTDEHPFSLSPRFVFLGGEETLEHFAERAKALPRWAVTRFTQEFGTIKHPTMVPIMLTLSAKKTAKDLPLKWFEDHADFARPLLEDLAMRKSPQGEQARLVIEKLDAPKPEPKAAAKKAKEPAAESKKKGAEKKAPEKKGAAKKKVVVEKKKAAAKVAKKKPSGSAKKKR